ncbi:Disease resistance protein [Quillaja saponaria]|uniref:Disease resistance protein n=1 Tax=Quillaja saponaria TaxID=32244 RepID=A0AAD7VDW2_QUISA|nr:Disease resistance protein [Quillaja saponaria]
MEFLIAIGTKVVSKVAELLSTPITTAFGYMFQYDKNISNLKDEHEKLKVKKNGVKDRVEADERNGREIADNVKQWLSKVDEINEEVDAIRKEESNKTKTCLGGWCPNLKSWFPMGRKVAKKTNDIVKLNREIKHEVMSYHPAPFH